MSFQNNKISILYGSQTGNAQDLAERIWRESKRFYFQSSIKPLDEYNVRDLAEERCAIIICSTTGQGEEPDNMKTFWKFLLRKSLPSELLCNLKFAVLGLGDSSYSKFNFVAKRLHKRLLQLGGQPLIPLGLGDDQHDLGYDAVSDPWIESLWEKLLYEYPLPRNIEPLPKNLPIAPRWSVKKDIQFLQHFNCVNKLQSIFYSTKICNEFSAKVIENSRQTDLSHFQDVRLIKFQTNGQEYAPGDLVVLRPKNLHWKIEEFKEVLKSNGVDIPDNAVLRLTETDQKIPVPDALKAEVSFQQLCEEYFDLFSIPRRNVFQILSQITDSDLEREKCLELSSAEGQQDMYSYTNRPRRNIVEVLGDFPHATKNLTLDILFEILPPIKPREFSIASSFKGHENEVHILLAVVKYKTNLVKERVGLCSNYLADLKTGDVVTSWFKRGSFRFPDNMDVPVIMVGPGTGVAPFRNFIFEVCDKNTDPNNLILFYGCRNKNKDFLCEDEFTQLEKENKITLICAFSRDQEDKVYVQDKIKEHQELVWQALQRHGYIFVAGNSKNMPQSVRQAFINVCMNVGAMSEVEAVKFIETMEKQNKYQTECWS